MGFFPNETFIITQFLASPCKKNSLQLPTYWLVWKVSPLKYKQNYLFEISVPEQKLFVLMCITLMKPF